MFLHSWEKYRIAGYAEYGTWHRTNIWPKCLPKMNIYLDTFFDVIVEDENNKNYKL